MSVAARRLLLNSQEFVYERILGHSPLATVAVLLERRAVTEEAAKQMLAARNARGGKIGCCVIVMRPSFLPNQDDASLRGLLLQDLVVLEHPTLNEGSQGTLLSAEAVSLELLQLLAFVPMGANSRQVYSPAPGLSVVPDNTFDGLNGWRVRLQVAAACPRDTRCGLVLIDPSEGAAPQTVTLSCATPGATIRYTLDGTYPRDGNPSAQVYSSPLAITDACQLLAAADLAGLQQSGLSAATFT